MSTAGTPQGGQRRDDAFDKVELYELAYEEGRRTQENLLEQLASIRTLTVQVLAFVGAATAFLVGSALAAGSGVNRDGGFYTLVAIGSLLLIAALVLAGTLVLGRVKFPFVKDPGWRATMDPDVLATWLDGDKNPGRTKFYRVLLERQSDAINHNRDRLNTLRRIYIYYLFVVLLQLLAWIVLAWVYV